MWWLLAIFSGVFLYGITRPRYTHNTYVENYVDVDCDGGGGESYCDSDSESYDSGESYSNGGSSDDPTQRG